MDVLVIDVGGSHVKMRTSTQPKPRSFVSGPDLTPPLLVQGVLEQVRGWQYDVISLGYPGAVHNNTPAADPGNLAEGWVGFDFGKAFDRPIRIVNDAVMQALGGYDGGRMLFLGLGTGLGSALVTEHVVVPMELGSLPYANGQTLAERLGREGLKTHGKEAWLKDVDGVTRALRVAFAADYVVLGGGNAEKVDDLAEGVRRGGNEDAFAGGFRMWEEVVEPHDRSPAAVWRVVR